MAIRSHRDATVKYTWVENAKTPLDVIKRSPRLAQVASTEPSSSQHTRGWSRGCISGLTPGRYKRLHGARGRMESGDCTDLRPGVAVTLSFYKIGATCTSADREGNQRKHAESRDPVEARAPRVGGSGRRCDKMPHQDEPNRPHQPGPGHRRSSTSRSRCRRV